ncbi:MAG TPA: hypothetical protein ENK06_09965, partial [Gammaproteobacteria bacterium]|nr:hypothetical protein [Gammaproteobacteria bacterium]
MKRAPHTLNFYLVFTLISALTSMTAAMAAPSAKLETIDPSITDSDWTMAIQKNIQQAEYRARPSNKGLQAPNRAHNIRSYFRENGLHIVDRTAKTETTLLNMQYKGLSRGN